MSLTELTAPCHRDRLIGMEGARRIKRLGQIVLILGSLAAFVLWLIAELSGLAKVGPVEQLLALLIVPVFFGGFLWAAGWILEGFLQPSGRTGKV